MDGRFAVTKRGGSNCPGTCRFGNAVLTRNRITWARRWRLPRPDGSEVRRLLCVRARLLGRPTRICTTHISRRGDDKRRRQIRTVGRRVAPWARAGTPVVLMGDFNVGPESPSLDRIYRPLGPFREIGQESRDCRCGEPTHGSGKIDYMFLSTRHFRVLDGAATRSGISDHLPLRGIAGRRR